MKQERTRKTPNVWQACVILVCVIAYHWLKRQQRAVPHG